MTIVSVQEQFEGRLGFLRKAGATQLVDAYRYFIDTLTLFHSYFPDHVLPYDSAAQAQDSILSGKYKPVKSMDRRIAAIAIVHSATLVTGNAKDFGRIMELPQQDWTVP